MTKPLGPNVTVFGQQATRFIRDSLLLPYGKLMEKYEDVRFDTLFAPPVILSGNPCILSLEDTLHATFFLLAPEDNASLCKNHLTLYGKNGFFEQVPNILWPDPALMDALDTAIKQDKTLLVTVQIEANGKPYAAAFLFNATEETIYMHLNNIRKTVSKKYEEKTL